MSNKIPTIPDEDRDIYAGQEAWFSRAMQWSADIAAHVGDITAEQKGKHEYKIQTLIMYIGEVLKKII